MIKINLLHSVTERQGSAAVVVERKIASPATRLMLMSLAVGFLLALVIGIDVISANMQRNSAEQQLEEQKQIAAQLESVMKEQKELEAKIQGIDARIAAIKNLRDSQAGPSAVLQEVSERVGMTPGIYLDSIDQAGDKITIKGSSINDRIVTEFGSSLEFSGGLFSDLNIETQKPDTSSTGGTAVAKAPEVTNFTIDCNYKPKAAKMDDAKTTTAQNAAPAGANPSAAAPPQVAKN